MASTRRLAAILAADVAGYSQLMGADRVTIVICQRGPRGTQGGKRYWAIHAKRCTFASNIEIGCTKPRSPPPARTARRLPAQSGRAPAEAMAACSHGARRRQQPALSRHQHPPRPRRAPAPLRAPVAAPVKSGSILPARCTTALAIAGTARPSKAVTCPKRRRRHRGLGRTTERLALRKVGQLVVLVCMSS
jgi:hypothetical protein